MRGPPLRFAFQACRLASESRSRSRCVSCSSWLHLYFAALGPTWHAWCDASLVQVLRHDGSSAVSKVVVHCTDPLPPGPVTALAPISATAKSVTLAWAPGASNGLPVSGYRLESAARSDPSRWDLEFEGPSTRATVATLVPGNVRMYRVCAMNAVRLAGLLDDTALTRQQVCKHQFAQLAHLQHGHGK
jgi:hypothetical protein